MGERKKSCGELLHSGDGVHNKRSVEEMLIEEINCILNRNQNEKFLRSLLTRACILEELSK